ncbi:MAG: hypothetical protein IK015_01135 [Treponema sp.]|nr:hypothetical protein [Treponema sp.]
MMKKAFASITAFFICLLAAPGAFSETKPTSFSTKPFISLPLRKSTKSVVCVNRNFNDTQKFGNAFCAGLDEYSFDCKVKLAEFVPKEEVVGYDYVWTFQVTCWKDKNLDDVPEKVKAVIYLYDKDFNLLAKSSVRATQSKDPQDPNCLELLIKEYLDSMFNDIVEVAPDVPEEKAKPKKEKKAKKSAESQNNEEQAE